MVEETGEVESQAVESQEAEQPVEQKEDDLRAQLESVKQSMAEAEARATKFEEESKKHQSSLSKKAEELARKEARERDFTSLSGKVDILANMMADIVDKGDYEEEQPKRRKSEEYLSKLSELNKPKPDAPNPEYMTLAQEADTLTREANLKMDESLELRQAYLLFRVGDAKAGLEEARRVVELKKTEAKGIATKTELTEDEEAEIVRKHMEKKDKLKTITGGPSAQGGKGRKPSLDELQASTPFETDRKVKSGEWTL